MCGSTKILLTMRTVQTDGYHDPRDAISQDWIRFLGAGNMTPVLVSNALPNPLAFAELMKPAALLLTNGEDICPELYGEHAIPGRSYSPERDQTESRLYHWALQTGVPVLAVCRGFQLLHVLHGGKLSDVPVSEDGKKPHVTTAHRIEICHPAFTSLASEAEIYVNSYHNQGVKAGTLAKGLIPFALSRDSWVEGFFHPVKSVLAMQWHPERPGPGNYFQKILATEFLSKGAWWI